MLEQNEEQVKNFLNWLKFKGRRENTISGYGRVLNIFFGDYLINKPFDQINKQDIEGFIPWKIDKERARHEIKKTGYGQGRLSDSVGELKASSINFYLSVLKKFLYYSDMHELNESIELAKVRRWRPNLSNTKKIIDFFVRSNYGEIEKIAERTIKARKKQQDNIKDYYIERDTLLLYVLFNTGCRIGEASNLKIDSFDFKKKPMSMILDGKTGERTILISSLLGDIIKKFVDKYNIRDYLFCSTSGGALSINTLKTYVWEFFRIGLKEKFHAHDLRHAYATFLLERGENIKKISNDLGHSSLDTTGIYLDIIQGKNAEVVSPIDYIQGKKGDESENEK